MISSGNRFFEKQMIVKKFSISEIVST